MSTPADIARLSSVSQTAFTAISARWRTTSFTLAVAATLISCSPPPDRSPSAGENDSTPARNDAAIPDASYTFGTLVQCGASGTFRNFSRSGWSQPEKDFTWTDGKAAGLVFKLPAGSGLLVLRMNLAANRKPPGLMSQSIQVYASGQKVADWEVTDRADYHANIPTELLGEFGELKIELKIPAAVSPQELELSADRRILGVCCWNLDLSQP